MESSAIDHLVVLPRGFGFIGKRPTELRRQPGALVGLIGTGVMSFCDVERLARRFSSGRGPLPAERVMDYLRETADRPPTGTLMVAGDQDRGGSYPTLRELLRRGEPPSSPTHQKVLQIQANGLLDRLLLMLGSAGASEGEAAVQLARVLLVVSRLGPSQRELLEEMLGVTGIREGNGNLADGGSATHAPSFLVDRNRFAVFEFADLTLVLPTTHEAAGSAVFRRPGWPDSIPFSAYARELLDVSEAAPRRSGSWAELERNGRRFVYPLGFRRIDAAIEKLLPAAEAPTAPEVESRTRPSIAARQERTRQVAVDWLSERKTPGDRAAVDEVTKVMLQHRNAASTPFTASVRSSLDRVGVENLEGRQWGDQVVAILVLERELERRIDGEAADLDIFANALTSYVCGLNRSQIEPRAWLALRVVRIVAEWLSARRLPADRQPVLPAALTTDSGWRELVAAAPWIKWYAPHADPGAPIRLDPREYLELLSLIRPRYVFETFSMKNVGTVRPRVVSVPSRWRAVYEPRGVQLTPDQLDLLADAMAPSLREPAYAARLLQAQDLPSVILSAADEILRSAHSLASNAEGLLGVFDGDGHGRRLMVANLDPRTWLEYRVGDDLHQLPPNALEELGATGYCSPPREITADGCITVADVEYLAPPGVPALLQTGSVTMAQLPLEMFRGREEQLARLKMAVGGTGPRAGAFIFGPRRAGKSTLAYRLSQDPSVGGSLWLDLSNTPSSIRDFASWSSSIAGQLQRKIRRDLRGLAWEPHASTDFVELLEELDTLLDGHPPIVVVLDEMDVMLLPEHESEGRRTAGRLGNLVLRNIALVGTVQRFHRSIQELKSWQGIECPADLTWADGVTYFTPPLAVETGPHLTFLDRAAVSPGVFASSVYPKLGLRPYFWAQLRSRIEAQVAVSDSGYRFCNSLEVNRHIAALRDEDAHLSSMLDAGRGYSHDDRDRLDLFSEEELRILATFGDFEDSRTKLDRKLLSRAGSERAVASLIDRQYLRWSDDRSRAELVLGIVHDFVRVRRGDIRALSGMPPTPSMTVSRPQPFSTSDERARRVWSIAHERLDASHGQLRLADLSRDLREAGALSRRTRQGKRVTDLLAMPGSGLKVIESEGEMVVTRDSMPTEGDARA